MIRPNAVVSTKETNLIKERFFHLQDLLTASEPHAGGLTAQNYVPTKRFVRQEKPSKLTNKMQRICIINLQQTK